MGRPAMRRPAMRRRCDARRKRAVTGVVSQGGHRPAATLVSVLRPNAPGGRPNWQRSSPCRQIWRRAAPKPRTHERTCRLAGAYRSNCQRAPGARDHSLQLGGMYPGAQPSRLGEWHVLCGHLGVRSLGYAEVTDPLTAVRGVSPASISTGRSTLGERPMLRLQRPRHWSASVPLGQLTPGPSSPAAVYGNTFVAGWAQSDGGGAARTGR